MNGLSLVGIEAMALYGVMGFVSLLLGRFTLYLYESVGRRYGAEEMKVNSAIGLRKAGVYLAVGTGLSGVFSGNGTDLWTDLYNSIGYAFPLSFAVIVALVVNDKFVLPGVNNSAAVREGNHAVAVVEIGGLIATGFIAKAAVAGEGGSFWGFLAYFALGQVVMCLLVRAYEAVQKRSFMIVQEVERGNLAAGIILGGKLWAYGLVMATAVGGPSSGIVADLTSFAITAAAGMFFLYIAELAIDKMLITWITVKESIESRSVSAAFVFAGAKIGVAYAISPIVI